MLAMLNYALVTERQCGIFAYYGHTNAGRTICY